MTPARARSLARGLLVAAAISAVLVLGAALIVPPVPVTAAARTVIDLLRFIGPPLALVTGLLALLHARRLERGAARSRLRATEDVGDDRADAIFRALVTVAVVLMAVGLLSALWSTLVLSAGGLLP